MFENTISIPRRLPRTLRQKSEILGSTGPGFVVPESPAAFQAAAAASQYSGGAPSTDLPGHAPEAASSTTTLDGAIAEIEMNDGKGLRRLENPGSRAGTVWAQGLLDMSIVAIKLEGEKVRTMAIPLNYVCSSR